MLFSNLASSEVVPTLGSTVLVALSLTSGASTVAAVALSTAFAFAGASTVTAAALGLTSGATTPVAPTVVFSIADCIIESLVGCIVVPSAGTAARC